uniref:Axin n=1 Tax=Strigamia maritima TaxID=126957 RepID=T1JHY6_STRMM
MQSETEPTMTYSVKNDNKHDTTDERRPADGKDDCRLHSPTKRHLEQADGSLATSSPFTESSTPPYLQWRESLRTLLDDSDGVKLFRKYLDHEQSMDYLNFWLACEGLKNNAHDSDAKKSANLIRIIYRKFIRGHLAGQAVQTETRKAVEENVDAAVASVNVHVFDDAQMQMEEFLNRHLYPNFLQSDLYLNYIQSMNVKGEESEDSGSCCGLGSATLATVDENEVLESVQRLPLTAYHLKTTQKRRALGWKRGEPFVGSNPSEQSSLYAMYAPCVTVSVQDSELQSLSSDAHTDDTMSLTDSSVDNFSVTSKKYLKHARRNASQNRESNLYVPLPLRPEMRKPHDPKLQAAEFAALLIAKLEVVKRSQENRSKLESKFDEIEKSTAEVSHASTFDALLKMTNPEEMDHQSILDAHVDRVWNDPPVSCRLVDRRSLGSFTSHHRQRFRERDLSSDLSTDSGTVRDYVTPGSSDSMVKAHHRLEACEGRTKDVGTRRTSVRSCGDHGGLAASAFPINANEKYANFGVRSWMNNHTVSDKDSSIRHRKSSSSSSLQNSQGKMKKPNWLEHSLPCQPLAQDPNMPMLPPPNTTAQLEEARRRLEDDTQARLTRSKSGFPLKEKMHPEVQKARTLPTRSSIMCDVTAGGDTGFNKKMNRKTGSTAANPSSLFNANENNDVTAILYCLQGESVPYLTKIAGKNVTLGQFKTLLSKKGRFRYFFKTANNELEIGVVNVEITDDNAILPLWEGKVCAQVHVME